MKPLSHYLASLRKKGWYFCFVELTKLFPIRWVTEKGTTDHLYQRRASKYLKRKYIPLLRDFNIQTNPLEKRADIIWTAWLQGEETAPELVKKCLASIRKYAGPFEVKVLTNDNISDYIKIPEFITKRLEKHQMQYAQYSDYIRAALLTEYGGIWVDSTVFLTGPIPERFLDCPLFLFKTSWADNGISKCSSWFISSQKNNRLMAQTKYLLESYWKNEHKLCDYYLFHLLLALVSEYDASNLAEWKNIPFANNCDVHRMQGILFEPYSEHQFKDTCSISNIHKLTYKIQDKKPEEIEGSLYEYIIFGDKKDFSTHST